MSAYCTFIFFAYVASSAATLAGFGSSTILMPVAVIFFDVKGALFLVACHHLFSNLFKVKVFSKKIDTSTFLRFGIPSILCAFIGARLVSILPVALITRMLAVFLILFSLYTFVQPVFRITASKISAISGGGLSGFFAGLIGLGGAIRSAFLIAFNLPKEAYIATGAAIALVIDITRVPTYLFTGIGNQPRYYAVLPLLVGVAWLGVRSGKALLSRINQNVFKRIVAVALCIAGIKLFFS